MRFIPPKGPPPPDARGRVLAAWRRVDLAPLEAIDQRPARPLSAIVPEVLARLRLDQRRLEAEVVRVWNQVLNPTLTAHAQPTALRHGTLFVSVDHNVWRDELVRYHRQEILERLQQALGPDVVTRISFRVG
jgi:predicted nucleic acid-binding Zn ribbon protein